MITVEKAIENFLELVAKGWGVETALFCCYDTVYDLIDLKPFAEKCLAAVEIAKNCQS